MLLWPLLLTAGLSPAPLPTYALQPAGGFHGDEPAAHDGETWLALQVEGDDAALVATRVQVRTVRDELLDEPGQATGREVSSALGDKAMMFLRGGNLVAGRIESARVTPAERESAAPPRYIIGFNGRDYRISTVCSASGDTSAEQTQFDCRVMFEAGMAQRLFDLGGYSPPGSTAVLTGDDGNAKLIFAGDLDRDGRLDLIFDVSDHYNVSRPTLFLSSQAAVGELVRQVAQYESVGC
jgi:hypothetical protein